MYSAAVAGLSARNCEELSAMFADLAMKIRDARAKGGDGMELVEQTVEELLEMPA